MKHYANNSKWNYLYVSLIEQAANNDEIIFKQMPDDATADEIKEVIQELRSVSNFKNYIMGISDYNPKNIKGIRKDII